MLSSRIDDYRGLDGPFGIRVLSVGILEHQRRAELAAAVHRSFGTYQANRKVGRATTVCQRARSVRRSLKSIPNALLVLSGSDAVQPRSKVGIWNFAVVDMSFGQCHRGQIPPAPPKSDNRNTGARALYSGCRFWRSRRDLPRSGGRNSCGPLRNSKCLLWTVAAPASGGRAAR